MTNPIPPDQQPLNEFKSLQESWFFGWGRADSRRFWLTLILIWLGWAIVALPLTLASFTPQRHPWKFIAAVTAGASIGLGFMLLCLALGWGYMYNRLHSRTIIYEETGWYDGQTWEKPEWEVVQHRLIADYQIKPILHRLWTVGLGLVGLLVASLILTMA